MAQDHRQEAEQEAASRAAWVEWNRQRVENIHQHVTAYDVLSRGGVEFKGTGSDEEQFSCPFHGMDRKPSARYYPEDAQSRSHAWCFVCQEPWDAISLWRRFHGGEEMSFTRALSGIEQEYGLEAPPMPSGAVSRQPEGSKDMAAFEALYEACEGRLRSGRPAYRQLDDMVGYLSAGQVLDKLRYRVDKRQMTPEQGQGVLQQLLDRIGAKVRSCPDV
jgi:hypothetical protein